LKIAFSFMLETNRGGRDDGPRAWIRLVGPDPARPGQGRRRG